MEVAALAARRGGSRVSVATSGALLHLERVTMQFGGLKAVSDLELEVAHGDSWADRPNGRQDHRVQCDHRGLCADQGRILLDGHPTSNCRIGSRSGCAAHVPEHSIVRPRAVPGQRATLFIQHRRRSGGRDARSRRFQADERELTRRPTSCSRCSGLGLWADTPASELPYGRSAGSRSRAPAGQPTPLDEPAAGLNPQESDQLMHRADPPALPPSPSCSPHDMRW